MVNQSKIKSQRSWDIWRASGAVGTLPFMEKYKEIAKSLGLDEFFEKCFDDIYEKLADLSNKVVPGNPHRMTDEAMESLFTYASASTQVGGSFNQFQETKRRIMKEGISDDRMPSIISAVSLAYMVDMVDMAVERFNQGGKSGEKSPRPRLLYQALDFLTLDEVQYLGL